MLGERRSMESTPLTSLEFFGFDHLRSGYEVSITTYYILLSGLAEILHLFRVSEGYIGLFQGYFRAFLL